MNDVKFQSIFTATWNGKTYPVVTLIDFVKGIVSFQDKNYLPSEIHMKPFREVILTPVTPSDI